MSKSGAQSSFRASEARPGIQIFQAALDSRFRRDFKKAYDFTLRDNIIKYMNKSIGQLRDIGVTCPVISKIKYGGNFWSPVFW